MIPVVWILPALLVTALAIDRTGTPGEPEGFNPEPLPPPPPPEPDYGAMKALPAPSLRASRNAGAPDGYAYMAPEQMGYGDDALRSDGAQPAQDRQGRSPRDLRAAERRPTRQGGNRRPRDPRAAERRPTTRRRAAPTPSFWDDLAIPEHGSTSGMDLFGGAPRSRAPKAPAGRLANVMQLSLPQAVEAARLRFLKGPVRSVTEGSGAILVQIDPKSTAALLVPPVYLGWPVQIREATFEGRPP